MVQIAVDNFPAIGSPNETSLFDPLRKFPKQKKNPQPAIALWRFVCLLVTFASPFVAGRV
jgi:hypothetical protein